MGGGFSASGGDKVVEKVCKQVQRLDDARFALFTFDSGFLSPYRLQSYEDVKKEIEDVDSVFREMVWLGEVSRAQIATIQDMYLKMNENGNVYKLIKRINRF
mmetsp:Transcript_2619/g.3761  ORF Transcript_2619/g.3761 Transcript_2619/m.3761 type:complete len:102 (-) Transcript_2619:396-701(-)